MDYFIIISAVTEQKKKEKCLKPVKNKYGLFHIIFCYFDRGIILTLTTTTKMEVLLLPF